MCIVVGSFLVFSLNDEFLDAFAGMTGEGIFFMHRRKTR